MSVVPAAAAARALADCAAIGVLGLAVVPALDTGRRREELARLAAGPLVVVSAAWVVTELVRQALAAARTAALPMLRLPLRNAVEFTLHTSAGRAGLISLVAATAVCGIAAVGRRSPSVAIAVAGAASLGIAARAVSGHLSENSWGAFAVAVHALAAATWCGGLAALVVTVSHRGQWARVLPRFSALSSVCVTVLLVTGVISALLVGGPPTGWYATGWGRLLVKVVLLIALVVLGWRNRTVWLPAARAHRATAERSKSRSIAELALMVVTLTIAAALSVTG